MSFHTHTHTHTLITVFVLQLSTSDIKQNFPTVTELDYLSVLRSSGDNRNDKVISRSDHKILRIFQKLSVMTRFHSPMLWTSVAILPPAAAPILRKWQSVISGFIRLAPFIRRPTPNGRQTTLGPSSAMHATRVTNALLYFSIVLY